jgi:pilus assembly protein FimV
MGRKLDAENPLYAESRTESEVPTEMPAELMAGAAAATVAASLSGRQAAAEEGAGAEAEPEPTSLADLDFTSSLPVGPSQSQMRDTWMVPGDLSQFGGDKDGSGLPDPDQALAAIEAATAPEAEAAIDANVIDFELDLGDEAAGADAAAEQAPERPAEDAGLTFDLEIDEPASIGAAVDAATKPETGAGATAVDEAADEASAAAAESADAGLVSALDFELPDLDLSPAAPQTAAGAGNVLSAREGGAAEFEAPVVDIEKTSFDSSLLDFDFDIDTPVPPPAAGAASLDLTSIDLDLGGFDAPASSEEAVPPSIEVTQLGQSHVEFPSADTFDADLAGSGDEVETKLELARAYDDMGDKEGALELLDEVVREGSAQQQAAAREMIARLS